MDAIEELKILESETSETSRKIEEAISKLEKEKREAVKGLMEIDKILPYHMALFHLGEMSRGDVETLRAKRFQLQGFINDSFPPAREGLENMRRTGHPKDADKRARVRVLRSQLAAYEEDREKLRKDLRSRTQDRKTELLKGAELLGLTEEAEAFLKELEEEAMEQEPDKIQRTRKAGII